MFVIIYLVVLAYFAIAAISPVVTTVPDTWAEWARIAVLFFLGVLGYWWGSTSAKSQMMEVIRRVANSDPTSTEE